MPGDTYCNEVSVSAISGHAVTVVKAPPSFSENTESAKSIYHQIRVIFDRGYWFRFSPGFSESQVIETAAYDWSEVSARLLPGERSHENIERVVSAWRETGVCPNPRMYEVVFSSWLSQLGLDEGKKWKHFLIAGSDGYIEIVAQGWKWLLGQPIDE